MADAVFITQSRNTCLANDKKCLKCQKVGHFTAVCWSKSVSEVSSDGSGTTKDSSADHWFLGSLSGDSGFSSRAAVSQWCSRLIQVRVLPPFQSLP